MLLFLVLVKLRVEFVVTKDVQWDAEGIACLSASLSKVESGDSNGVVDNDLIVVPARMTAHSAVKTLKELFVFIGFPSSWFGNQSTRLSTIHLIGFSGE
jgi:hypothetical protein